MVYDVIIIGGGAAGLFCAANTELKNGKGLVLESMKRTGIKLMAAGSGQCNFTHGGDIRDFIDKYGKRGGKIRGILYKFNNIMVRDYFEDLGVTAVEREDGKVFPKSMNSRDIRDVLLNSAVKGGFEINTETKVVDITKINEGDEKDGMYEVASTKGSFRCRRLVIATGGKSYPKTGSDGSMMEILKSCFPELKINDCVPALTSVYVEDYRYSSLSGISAKVKITMADPYDGKGKKRITGYGDMLFTHKNLSGPVILDNSRYLEPGRVFYVDYAPEGYKSGDRLPVNREKRSIGNLVSEECKIPKALADALTDKALGEKGACRTKASTLTGSQIKEIEDTLRNQKFTVSGKGGFGEAMVTAGGVDISEISTSSMEAKKYPGLYLVGEVLDIDGDTGGYNLQFAFSSARTAAQHISL